MLTAEEEIIAIMQVTHRTMCALHPGHQARRSPPTVWLTVIDAGQAGILILCPFQFSATQNDPRGLSKRPI